MSLKTSFLSLILLFCISLSSFAITYTTIKNGNWTNPNSWDANGSPGGYWGAGDTVIVGHDVNLNADIGFHGVLIIRSSASISGNRNLSAYNNSHITADGAVEVNSFSTGTNSVALFNSTLSCTTLRIGSGSTFSVSQSLEVQGSFDNNGGEVSLFGPTGITGNFSNNSGTITFNERTTIGGAFNNNSAAQVNVNDSVLISGNLNNNSNSNIDVSSTGYIGVGGNVNNNSGSSINSDGEIEISGNFNNNGGSVQNDGIFITEGDLTINNGTFTNDGVTQVLGTLTINSGGVLDGSGLLRADDITNYGTIAGSNDICGTDDSTSPTLSGGGSLSGSSTYCNESAAVPLPIQLKYFKVIRSDQDLVFEWQTISEINNHYFEVEFSKDGKEGRTLFRKRGAGNSRRPINYRESRYAERYLLDGYYRLKQTDFDGSVTYSDWVQIETIGSRSKETADFTLYPNPNSKDPLYLELKTAVESPLSIVIYNSFGKEVFQTSIASNFDHGSRIELLNADRLPVGQYFVRINSDHISESLKLFISK